MNRDRDLLVSELVDRLRSRIPFDAEIWWVPELVELAVDRLVELDELDRKFRA